MKYQKLFTISLACVIGVAAFTGCSSQTETGFSATSYVVADGESVTANQKGATYRLLGDVPEGVSVSESGVFHIESTVPDSTQVILAAVYNGKVIATTYCTLSVPYTISGLSFTGLSEYVIQGECVSATCTPTSSIGYSLKTPVDGVSIDYVSGKVSYAKTVQEGTTFTVVASSHGQYTEKNFKAAISHLVTAQNTVDVAEYEGDTNSISYTLDYSDVDISSVEEAGVLGVRIGQNTLTSDQYTYDATTHTVTILPSILKELSMGENDVKIYTAKNTVSVVAKVARLVATAADLAAIRNDAESLGGYYVMVDDIDLTAYLAEDSEGWKPIGTYYDEQSNATADAFTGTFDGNGHTITGFFINRISSQSNNYTPIAFNAGLFGYVTSSAEIKNLGLVQSESITTNTTCSYSGGLVGNNLGTISNCWLKVTMTGSEENVYKNIGGFAGMNQGTISNCYLIGGVQQVCENAGTFVGSNLGTISNCYAVYNELTTDGAIGFYGVKGALNNCTLYASENEFYEQADFSEWTDWTVGENAAPTLSSLTVAFRRMYFAENTTVYYQGETIDLSIVTAPEDLLVGQEVTYRMIDSAGNVVEGLRIQDNAIVIPDDYSFLHNKITVIASSGTYMTTRSFTINKAISIGTVDEFMAWKQSGEYDIKVSLTADLDFEGATITSIGNGYEPIVFSGVFEGNGYTIQNVVIRSNDYKGTSLNEDDGSELDNTSRWHTSYYNVGFFSMVTGTVRNVTFKKITVDPTMDNASIGNMIGIICGTLEASGLIENCSVVDCTLSELWYETDTAVKVHYVVGKQLGTVKNCDVIKDGKEIENA